MTTKHGGAWKVAYADFVTAMMALFIVLWLLSASEKVQKAVGGYFQDPTGKGPSNRFDQLGRWGNADVESRHSCRQLKEKLEQVIAADSGVPAHGEANQNHADHRGSADRFDRNGARSFL